MKSKPDTVKEIIQLVQSGSAGQWEDRLNTILNEYVQPDQPLPSYTGEGADYLLYEDVVITIQEMDWGVLSNEIDAKELLGKLLKLRNRSTNGAVSAARLDLSENEILLLGDSVLTENKKNPNHITTQLDKDNITSYNTGFHKGFCQGYEYSALKSGAVSAAEGGEGNK